MKCRMAPQRSASSHAPTAAAHAGPLYGRHVTRHQPHPSGHRSDTRRPHNAPRHEAPVPVPPVDAPFLSRSRLASADLEPDNEGWIEVCNRRRPRRYTDALAVRHPPAPKPRIPRWLRGRCFKCPESRHVKDQCAGEICCHLCWTSGHIAHACSSNSSSRNTASPPPAPSGGSAGRPSKESSTSHQPLRPPPPPLSMAHYPPLASHRFPGEL